MHARAHSGPWLANYNHLRLSARNCARTKLRGEFRVLILQANFFMFLLLISNHTVFLVQFGINLHLWVFQKAEIALAEAARAISTFWKTHSCKLIPNWTRNRMITYTNIRFIQAGHWSWAPSFPSEQIGGRDTKMANVVNTASASAIGSISAAFSCLVYPPSSGEERGLISRTAAGNRAYLSEHFRKVQSSPGSEIALSWSPMRLKILYWRPEFHNWSPAGD